MAPILKRVLNKIVKEFSQIECFRVPAEQAHQESIKKYASHLPKISAADSAIVNALKEEKICVASLADMAIPSTSEVLQASQQLLPKLIATPVKNPSESVIHATSDEMIKYPSIFLWGLEDRLLNIIENYLGLPVAYQGLYLRRDLANGLQSRTRLWHLDKEDWRMLKIIIYLKDVGHDDGPFQYIPRSLTHTICGAINHNYDGIQDKVMEQVVPQSQWKSCVGSAGTVILADTASIFHRGKLPIASDRLTIFFDYTSKKPKHPYYCKSSFSLNELIQLNSHLSQSQKDSVLWNEKLWKDYHKKLNQTTI
ncbi:hypothetical protein Cri9333_0164 [Crinalium epipsammum PCC 9333]|uniref:Phytanoyl-CoA dioxygenase n=1 Tax=Crinalium epipsammum PCC 9333 TaxID=1173022 RepID=K9VUC2_9CYAN|nr:hypothetical protein [Crinalium epipsammum]AFZ11164.1 hypothetical protein Cri9333_0164 [Crinalium epipsammum PCC 9333]